MRGNDEQQLGVFSYVSPEQRIPHDHPLRPLRAMADAALRDLQPQFNKLYAKTGRPSIAPEKLLRALLLQVLYSVRSERMLMEQLQLENPEGIPDQPSEQGTPCGEKSLPLPSPGAASLNRAARVYRLPPDPLVLA
jgi:hypothetical protein